MMKKVIFIFLISSVFFSFNKDKPVYQIFTKNGKQSEWGKLVKQAQQADVILFGELHDNPICHWLELQLVKDLYAEKAEKIILGAEMLEADQQLIVDEYIYGTISKKNFEDQARLWPNHKTDYAPLIDFAAAKKIRFVASNIPRRYAAIVNAKGFEGLNELSAEAKASIAPLPISYDAELPGYKSMLSMGAMGKKPNENLPKAQAAKDATMAYFILKNLKPGFLFLHFNGTYHSNNYEGIVWYLKKQNPDLKILTIASVEQNSLESLASDNQNLADFILCFPDDMIKTY